MIERTGLVLEGGGMRGLYTAGVLDCWLDHEIYFKNGIGVSAGACHGSSYFCRQKGRAFRVSVDYLDDKNYCGIYSFLKTGDFFGVEMAYHTIPTRDYPLDNETFQKTGANFYAVVTNCDTGKAEYKQIKDVYKDLTYVRASASLPLMSRMVEVGGEKLLDGGIADSIPLKAFEGMGFERNVVVLTQPRAYRKSPNRLYPLMKLKYRGRDGFLNAIKNRHTMYNQSLEYIYQQEAQGKALVIGPKQALGIGRLEKDREKLESIYKQGYRDGEENLPELEAFLNNSESKK